MSSTQVPGVIDWLLANLPDITGWETIEGAPARGTPREHIELTGGTAGQEYRTQSARRPGGPLKDETATIDVLFVSMRPGEKNTDARQRVFAAHDLVDERLRSNGLQSINLGGLVCTTLFTTVEWAYMTGDKARGCALHSRLTATTKRL